MSKPAGRMIRSCLGKARRLTFPGLKPWAVFRSSFGRLEYAQENVQTAERYGAVTVELNLIDPISRADRVDQYRLHRRHEAGDRSGKSRRTASGCTPAPSSLANQMNLCGRYTPGCRLSYQKKSRFLVIRGVCVPGVVLVTAHAHIVLQSVGSLSI